MEKAPKYMSHNISVYFAPSCSFWKLWLEMGLSGKELGVKGQFGCIHLNVALFKATLNALHFPISLEPLKGKKFMPT